MEPPLRKASSRQEQDFGVQPRRAADLALGPLLRGSSGGKSRRAPPFSCGDKVGQNPRAEGTQPRWALLVVGPISTQEEDKKRWA